MKKIEKRNSVLTTLPLVIFSLLFVLTPFVYLVLTSFSGRGDGFSLTFDSYKKIWDPLYRQIYIDSLTLGLISTVLVTLIGYPFGYYMAKLTSRWKQRFNFLLTLPFFVSSILRLYSWDIILRNNGPINKLLLWLGIISTPLKLKYTYGATVVGTIYALLPFMIFAVYSSAEKLDWSLVEASRDLGASAFRSFITITLPLTLPGLLSGIILTFIPSMGLIFISEILGGNTVVLVGNLIQQESTQGRNRPFAAALAVVLMLMTNVFIWGYRKLFKVDELEGLV